MRYVLDANAAIAAMNDIGSVRPRLAHLAAAEVGIPIVQHDALLVTSDRGLLDRSIPGLRAEDWLH
jgi:hypothetical protein